MVIKVLEITLVCGKLFSHPPGLGHAGVLGTHLVKAGVSVPGLSPARGLFAEWSREKEPEQRVWVAQGWGRVGAGQWEGRGAHKPPCFPRRWIERRDYRKTRAQNRGCACSTVHLNDRPC